jgi:hypothetical protein
MPIVHQYLCNPPISRIVTKVPEGWPVDSQLEFLQLVIKCTIELLHDIYTDYDDNNNPAKFIGTLERTDILTHVRLNYILNSTQ